MPRRADAQVVAEHLRDLADQIEGDDAPVGGARVVIEVVDGRIGVRREVERPTWIPAEASAGQLQ